MRAAIGEPGEEPALLLEISSQAVRGAVEFPEAKGFRLFPETIRSGPNGETRLCLMLADIAYRDVFSVLAEDIADAVGSASTHGEAVAKLFARLRAWQAFMRRGATGLSEEEQTGLFGELVFLGELLDAGIPASVAVAGWTGVRAGLRDFAYGACEIEVKAATGSKASRFHVSHLDQLDETAVGTLLLCHYALAEDSGGNTLTEVVAGERKKLAGADPATRALFEESLITAGYVDLHSRQYDGRCLVVRRCRVFKVTGDFPRIVRSDVRPGIVDAGYAVDVQSCTSYEISSDEAMRIIKARGDVDV